ncbi:MAG: acyltransferase, partial [Verrucomicrobia bacterium]
PNPCGVGCARLATLAIAPPPPQGLGGSSRKANYRKLLTPAIAGRFFAATFANGPSAVIVFFVISGFCIHLPNIRPAGFRIGAHYAQRFLRILPPMGAALLLGGFVGAKGLSVSRDTWQLPTILWSLVAELVYYALYPALRLVAARIGWGALLAASYGLAAGAMMLHSGVKGMQSYGYHLTWLVGLPCWLLSCLLAERRAGGIAGPFRGGTVPAWRAAMFVLSAASWQSLYRGTSLLPTNAFIITLQGFAVAAYFWLGAEMERFKTMPPPRWMESAGTWSYSLYLFHELGRTLWERLPLATPQSTAGVLAASLARMAGILALCWVFHRLVEAPSHRLARAVGRRIRQNDASAGP